MRRTDPRRHRDRAIQRATLEELARSDFGTISFERIARRAGVNKTTLYRRYASKTHLVGAVLSECTFPAPEPTSGCLRTDLARIARRTVDFAASPEGRLFWLCLVARPSPELVAIASRLHRQCLAALESIVRSGVGRGELAPETDVALLLELLVGVLHLRVSLSPGRTHEETARSTVEMLLRAAAHEK